MDARNTTLKVGDTDSQGKKVSEVFAYDPLKKYAIWETTDGKISVDCDGNEIQNTPELAAFAIQIGNLTSGRAAFENKYNSHIAYAYKQCLDGDSPGAIKTLETTLAEIRRLLKAARSSKVAYLLGALISAIILEIAWIFFRVYEANCPKLGQYDATVTGIAVSILGGVLSITNGLRTQSFDLDDPFFMTMLYGGLRVVIAVLTGFVTTLMVQTGVVLSFLKEQNAYGGFLLACFLGGYSERWVSNSLRNLEKTPES